MDLTIQQLRKGNTNDLLTFKSEIISYLSNKKYSSKSTTLLATLKMLNKELRSREEKQKIIDELIRQNRDKEDLPGISVSFAEFPSFLQDDMTMTSKKRTKVEKTRNDCELLETYTSCFEMKNDLSLDFENNFEDYSEIFYNKSKDFRKASSTSYDKTASSDSLSLIEQSSDEDVYSYLCFS